MRRGAAAAGIDRRAPDIVGDREAAERARQLEAADEAQARALVRRQPVDPRRPKSTQPALSGTVPLMQLTSVVLPEPFGPIRPSRSPGIARSR